MSNLLGFVEFPELIAWILIRICRFRVCWIHSYWYFFFRKLVSNSKWMTLNENKKSAVAIIWICWRFVVGEVWWMLIKFFLFQPRILGPHLVKHVKPKVKQWTFDRNRKMDTKKLHDLQIVFKFREIDIGKQFFAGWDIKKVEPTTAFSMNSLGVFLISIFIWWQNEPKIIYFKL